MSVQELNRQLAERPDDEELKARASALNKAIAVIGRECSAQDVRDLAEVMAGMEDE